MLHVRELFNQPCMYVYVIAVSQILNLPSMHARTHAKAAELPEASARTRAEMMLAPPG